MGLNERFELWVRGSGGCFRAGEWAKVIGVTMFQPQNHSPRPCFQVMFSDGQVDDWPIYESGYSYEFEQGPPE